MILLLRKLAILVALAMCLVLAACSLPKPPGQPVFPTPDPSPAAASLPSATPFLPADLTPAASAGPGTLCVKPRAHPGFQAGPFSDIAGNIAAFLNSGATPTELDGALKAAVSANPPAPVSSGDINGDGMPDVVVSVVDPASSAFPTPGKLLVYLCHQGAYQLGFSLDPAATYGAPGVQTVQDLNADGKAEVVIGEQVCGAHTCFTAFQVLEWDGQGMQNRLTGRTDDIPYPRVEVKPVTEGGIAEIVLQGGLVGSVGAGPQRAETRTYAFNSGTGTWNVSSDELAPSNYRIHVLQEADAFLQKGEVDQALSAYNQVLSDQPPLQDYQDPTSEKLNLGAYAAYKIVAIHTTRGEKDQAKAMLDQMVRTYEPNTPQYAFVEMAQAYQDAFSSGGTSAACNAVTEYSQAHSGQVLDPLSSKVFGYANKDYHPQDMCP